LPAPRNAVWLFALHKVSGIVTRLQLNKPAVGPFRRGACPAGQEASVFHRISHPFWRRFCPNWESEYAQQGK